LADDVIPFQTRQSTVAARLCNFETGQADLLNSHRAWLDANVKPAVLASPNPWVDLWGYASHLGDHASNQRLSFRRCEAVKRWVAGYTPKVTFPADNEIGYGDSRSTGGRTDNDGYWRSVEVYVYAQRPNPRPVPVPPPRPSGPAVRLSGSCHLIGEKADDPLADDMKWGDTFASISSAAMAAAVAGLAPMTDVQLEAAFVTAMTGGMGIGAGTGGAHSPALFAEGIACVGHFNIMGGRRKVWGLGSAVSDAAKTNAGLNTALLGPARSEVDRAVRDAWTRGTIDDAAIAASIKRSGALDGLSVMLDGILAAYIGGIHAYRVELCNLIVDTAAETFTYGLNIDLLDHFGLDEGDVARSGGGAVVGAALLPFFVLQHFRADNLLNRTLHKYRPFYTQLLSHIGPLTRHR